MSKQIELRNSNNELEKLLNKENYAAMSDMVVYLRSANISDYQVELVRQDLLDMALGAQERNEPLSQVMGGSYQSFCDEVIKNVEHRTLRQRIIEWLMILIMGFSVLGIIDIVFSDYLSAVYHSLTLHSKVDTSYPISAGFVLGYVVIVCVSYLIVFLIGKYSFKTKTILSKISSLSKPKRFVLGGLVAAVLIGYLIVVAELDKFILFSINVFIYLAVLLLFFVLGVMYSKFPHLFEHPQNGISSAPEKPESQRF